MEVDVNKHSLEIISKYEPQALYGGPNGLLPP